MKAATRRYRDHKQGITNKIIRKGITQVIIDACGTEHPVDYEGRRKDWDKRGCLAKQYSIGFEDKAGELTNQGHKYLGAAQTIA